MAQWSNGGCTGGMGTGNNSLSQILLVLTTASRRKSLSLEDWTPASKALTHVQGSRVDTETAYPNRGKPSRQSATAPRPNISSSWAQLAQRPVSLATELRANE